jgi:23S rRNA (pseudouridine1915-N3)-methyltransferase
MLIRLVWVGRTRDAAAAGWVEEYRKRIGHVCPVEIVEIKDAAGKGAARAARESRDLAKALSGKGLVVALEETGREMTSREFSSFLGKAMEERGEISFLLGGAEGLDTELLDIAHDRLALSRMTLTHEMARVILMEQIYRGFSILKGTPYHR